MTPRIASLAVAVLTFQAVPAPVNNAAPASVGPAVGYFEASADIGSPAIAGSTAYDEVSQTYTLSARRREHVVRARRVPVRLAPDERRPARCVPT